MKKEDFMALAGEAWPELEALQATGDFLTFERRYVEIMDELRLKVLQAKLGAPPVDRRKKKA